MLPTLFPISMKSHTLFCTTSEKCDFATRFWNKRVQMFAQIALWIVDEVHLLDNAGGAVLKALIGTF
jgi:replicative superfamily II helicase